MDKYSIKLLSRAYYNLDDIYSYISAGLLEPQAAQTIIESLEEAIYSLEDMPYRGSIRKTGSYARKGYRQLFIKNFTAIYRIDEANKQVVIVTVKYSKSEL